MPSKKWQKKLASDLEASYTAVTASNLEALGEEMKDEAKIQLRLPADIRDWFKQYSDQRNRSMNGQMIELIKEKRDKEKREAEKGKASNA
ncbi:Arc family DNA-binding protein [Paraburkholderia graminis]|uniref:Arc family DNA-binding protein n=1 Tax=Paraburkholderia graminis TaxID=60548 RepID=UPI0038B9DEC6